MSSYCWGWPTWSWGGDDEKGDIVILPYVIVSLALANVAVGLAILAVDVIVLKIWEEPRDKWKIRIGPERWENQL